MIQLGIEWFLYRTQNCCRNRNKYEFFSHTHTWSLHQQQVEQLLTNQEYELEKTERLSQALTGADQAEEVLKKHESFVSSMSSVDERIASLHQDAERLAGNQDAAKIQERAEKIEERRKKNHEHAEELTKNLRVRVCVQN